ncbi:MAG: hypothetical protein Q9164_005244 [Protoblastenia rupestris]
MKCTCLEARAGLSATIAHLERDLQQLGKVLWSWSPCDCGQQGRQCVTENCAWQRSKCLKPFFDHFKDLAASYEPENPRRPALSTHEDLIEIIRKLKANPDVARAQLASIAFKDQPPSKTPPLEDQAFAINLAVKIMTMINCSAQHQTRSLIEQGMPGTPWRSDMTLSQFILDSFPQTSHPSLDDGEVKPPLDVKPALEAAKIKRIIGLKFQGTDDLRMHLTLNRNQYVVYIYHHTAFLKENLRLTKDKPSDMSISETLKLGALPRQLMLETLDSIQKILFPLTDPKSKSLLLSLTATSSFDPDCLRFESTSIRNDDEREISYHYFGARLMELYAELENPTPRGWVEKWFERKSGARYVMMATLLGVIAAVVLGVVGVAVSAFQAWVTYQQWQHPVSSSLSNKG